MWNFEHAIGGGRSSFTKWVNQSPHFVLPLVHTGVSKTGTDLQYVYKKQDEINSKKWRHKSDYQPCLFQWGSLVGCSILSSSRWVANKPLHLFLLQPNDCYQHEWLNRCPPSPQCLALTWTLLIWGLLVSDEVSLSFLFHLFIFFPFCQVDWCFELPLSFSH